MLKPIREPRELIENRVSFAGPNAELSVYSTYMPAERVNLHAGELLYCGMLNGKKILHGPSGYRAKFLPRESFVMAPGEDIEIDFPEAAMGSPTNCLTIEIARKRVDEVCSQLNKTAPLHRDFEDWHYRPDAVIHTPHTQATQALLERMMTAFSEELPDRNLLIDLGISELLVRMLRQQTRSFLLRACALAPDANGLSAAVHAIQRDLAAPLDIDQLCKIACMSRSRFFSEFKKHLGCTPAEFQHQLRMQSACERLKSGEPAKRICFDLGYCNQSHFSRRFQHQFGLSPSQYCQLHRRRAVN